MQFHTYQCQCNFYMHTFVHLWYTYGFSNFVRYKRIILGHCTLSYSSSCGIVSTMLPLSRIMLPMILGVVFQYVDGNQRIVHVSDHEDFASGDDKDPIVPIASDEDDNSLICCVYGNCSCSSLDHALANLTSNVLINITTDVTLSSLVTVSDLENVSIIGHNNPTVNCRKFNEIQFNFSRHLIVQGITWIGCGTDNINHTKPGLSLSYSSNVTIQNCTFQQWVGQAIVLSEMSGDVNINKCEFVNNNHYRGHGAAIHYSSSTNNTINYSQFVLTIKNCNFSYNIMKSLVYLENKHNKIILNNSTFCYNRGISVYAINHKIYLNGNILFENNTADNGAGIYISDHSTVTFVNNSEVTFIQNSAKYNGGAVFLRNHSSIIFDQNSVVGFTNNYATNGTVYSDAWSNVTFKVTCHVTFSGNSATHNGAVIYSDNYSIVTFTGNSNVTFRSNYASYYKQGSVASLRGAAIYSSDYSSISFEGSSTTLFINNIAVTGGAIYSSDYSSISFKGSSTTMFIYNTASLISGAIGSSDYSYISFEGSSTTLFINNDAYHGGAIYSDYSSISFEGNSTTTFSNNYVYISGGAIYHENFGSISFKGNASTMFSNNTAADGGGAIRLVVRVNMFFGGNSATTFIDNNSHRGGAISCSYNCSILHDGNSTAMFNNNIADSGGAIYSYRSSITFEGISITVYYNNTADDGGAVYSGIISFDRNSTVVFSNNMANHDGGAVFSGGNVSFNRNSNTEFRDNTAIDNGGAVYSDGGDVSFNGNSNTTFRDNTANDNGGAVFSDGGVVSFNGNSDTEFRDNTAIDNGGAVFSDGGDVSFNGNSNTTFRDNTANHNGGAVFSDGGVVSFNGNSDTTFRDNTANDNGGAVYSDGGDVSLNGNSNTAFRDNTANDNGGAVFSDGGDVSFNGNSNTEFRDNTVKNNNGGAIELKCVNMLFGGNSATTFIDNNSRLGGAIDCIDYCSISHEGNSTTMFNNNIADYGGAVYCSTISFNRNSTVVFRDNMANHDGGAVFSADGDISFNGNSNTEFRDNSANNNGGAVITDGDISFNGYSNTEFRDNTANNNGGAVYSDGDVSFNGYSNTEFRDNTANNNGRAVYSDGNVSIYYLGYGGAIMYLHANLIFNHNSTVNFTNIKATNVAVFSRIGKITELGNPTVIFNDHTVNWCANTCLPYTYHLANIFDAIITIDSNGIVRCSDEQEAFVSLSRKCGNRYLEDILVNLTSNGLATISDKVIISSIISLTKLYNVSIIGSKNHSITCFNNTGLQVKQCNNITIKGLNWIGCGTDTTPVINISNSSDVTLQKCLFQKSKGQAVVMFELSGYMKINHCKFINNTEYRGHGAAVHYSSNTATNSQLTLVISNCNFSYNEGAMSLVYINGNAAEDTNISLCNSFFHNNIGISVYLSSNILHIHGVVLFENNAAENGAGIYINKFSKVMFDDSSNVKFTNNFVNHSGAAVFLNDHSSVLFDQNSVVAFNDNNATNGIIYSVNNSNVTFKGTSEVTFSSNSATQYGAAIYSSDNSHVTFTRNSNVMFNNNAAGQSINLGGTVYCEYNSSLIFEDNSAVAFHDNTGYNGGAILSQYNSVIIFEDTSTVMFNNNKAHNFGGALFAESGRVTIKDNSTVKFNSNKASLNGGAVYCKQHQSMFGGNSVIMFSGNEATDGGAIYSIGSNLKSIIPFFEFAKLTFKNNTANQNGGAMYCGYHQILFGGNSMVTFSGNNAKDGGAFHATNMCKIIFSSSAFSNNDVINGGTMLSSVYSDNSFIGTSTATFNNNAADNGGTFYLTSSATLIFNDNVMMTLKSNRAGQNGGVLYFMNSSVLFNGSSTVSLADNEATLSGGVMYCDSNCNIAFSGFTNVSFNDNNADNGGAGYFNGFCSVTFKQNANVTFENNNALYGGAICLNSNTNITFNDNSTALFKNNMATNDGGAINIVGNSSIMVNDNTTITFTINNALYGGAMFFDATHTTLSFNKNERNINFNHNTARIAGSYMYFDSTRSSGSCLNDRIIGINNETKHFIATPPDKLEFYAPTTCTNYDNKTGECNTYHLKHIMLGEEINIPVCVFNYCNQPSYSIPFLLHEVSNQNYSISGSKRILISCNDTFQGISLTGTNGLTKPSNYTINISLHDDRNSDWKQISVNLIVELTSCHPGFWQYSSQKCECYNTDDIVFCSDSNSTIKRGYWFGNVTGKPTVTVCPVNYCDFTCCEASNGYYHLSPVRNNQCRSHRSGTACGSCTDGYTLSFDSTECVNVDSCTAGQTVLVILLTVIYWIVMVILVFAMMYYKVPIGYLYSITYYYSIVDILQSQNLQASRGLYLTVSILSSFSKITPQFLGELCLTTGMSGIDQQFIHYIHPTAVILILVLISLSARSSRRISAFISRGIIHVICLILLLAYTSIASTSLLLMRSLMFHGIDKIYTYLSPDIEYFHGRHLAYGIVALLCTITIVVGLPLLLILEPFLNRKINFAKIKPLLDQFQGCYKDKYRCFAGYYMICRLVIITIVIANSSNEFVANYFLIVACGVITLIHITTKPYNNEIINKFDDMILLLIIFITALPLLDDFDSPLAISIVFVLVLLPLLTFTAITLFLHKNGLKKIAKYFTFKDKASNGNGDNIGVHNQEIPMKEFDLIVDDSARKNVAITVCDT